MIVNSSSTNGSYVDSSILQTWKIQRHQEKKMGIGFLGHLIRKIGLIASAILMPPLALTMGIYHVGVKLKEYYFIRYRPNSVLSTIRNMKQKEEWDKFETMKRVLNDLDLNAMTATEGARSLSTNLKGFLSDPIRIQNKAIRYLLRALKCQENFNQDWIEACKDADLVHSLNFAEGDSVPQVFEALIQERYPHLHADMVHLNWNDIAYRSQKATISSEVMDERIREFEVSLTKLLAILKSSLSESNAASANPRFIAAFRHVLNSPVYQALKEEASHPVIQLLHRFASDMWNKAPSMDAYRSVGVSLMEDMAISDEKELDGPVLAGQLIDSHQRMESLHYAAHGLSSFSYALTHPLQIMGALASEGGPARHIPGIFGLDVYDSHGTLANNPSLQGVTKINWQDDLGTGEAKIHNCYGGSPTIGDHKIAPEFEALIQAAENNQLTSNDLRDPHIPLIVNYSNLQYLDKKYGEGPRSRTIMLLNQKYPFSFKGMTLAKDSNFYLMQKPESIVWTNPEEFGEKMLEQLMKSFDPQAKGHGFYFPGTADMWRPVFEQIIQSATSHFAQLAQEKPEFFETLHPRELQGAYQEYVYSALNAISELESVKALRGLGIENPTVMAITACKENIDRGGMENAKYLYTRLSDSYSGQKLSLVIGAMHSRALSARDRVILKSRMPQVLSFMKTTNPLTFRNHLMTLFTALNYSVSEHVYHPHVDLD